MASKQNILVCATNCGQRASFSFDDRWPSCHGMPMVREEHGLTCLKVGHMEGRGYLHEAHDDGPYDVDGVTYCGRCHREL